jgi:hypothetical protein
MSVFDDATPRQQDILKQLGRRLGFNVNDLTSVIYTDQIPTVVNFSNAQGSFTRDTRADLGGIVNDLELQNLRNSRTASFQSPVSSVSSPRGGNPSNNFFKSSEELSASDRINDIANELDRLQRRTDSSITNVSENRLTASGLFPGAGITRNSNLSVTRFPSTPKDLRVKISDPSGRISRSGGALAPLERTDFKVVFPYTPEINLSHTANYSSQNPTHSNYEYLFYQNSTVSEISISATFTARNSLDADYVLAVQHFFRSITKMFYGQDNIAGLPPVVCRLEGHGDLQFSFVPVVITGFTSTLPGDVDYISATNTNLGRVPTLQTMLITAKPIYSRNRITNEFSLTKFASGSLLGNPDTGQGGFI